MVLNWFSLVARNSQSFQQEIQTNAGRVMPIFGSGARTLTNGAQFGRGTKVIFLNGVALNLIVVYLP